jgi:DNA-binding MurR/RpiR family transcriptional regulator
MDSLEERIKVRYPKLTNKQRKISRFVIENLEETAFLSLRKVAQQAKVSEASVTRFCLALGYDGYGEIQKDLQAWIKSRITPLIKIRKSIYKEKKENHYSKVVEADLTNLEALREKIPATQLDQAVQFIIEAEKVYVIGMRSSYAPAYLLAHYLNHIGICSELLDPQGGRLLDRAIGIRPRDVVVGISFPRYFKQTVEVLRYARSERCRTIVITDSVLSPAGQNGDTVITAKYNTPIPFLSYVSVLSLINCLVSGVVMKQKNKSVAVVADIERMLEAWDCCIAIERPSADPRGRTKPTLGGAERGNPDGG